MGLEKVINEITLEAKEKADAIIKEGATEGEAIIAKEKERLNEERKKNSEDIKKISSNLKSREIAALRLQLKKSELKARKEILDEVFKKAEENISKDKEKEKILRALIEKGKKELQPKSFYSNKKDRELIEKIAPELKFKASIETIGGLILENEDGTIRANNSFETIFEKVSEKNLSEINKRLFSE